LKNKYLYLSNFIRKNSAGSRLNRNCGPILFKDRTKLIISTFLRNKKPG
jgi:hypothetical protein